MENVFHLYQPLFDHMHDNHGLILTFSEMDDIIQSVKKVKDNFEESIK